MIKKILCILIVMVGIIGGVYGYDKYLNVITYVGVSAPTQDACGICGDPRGERSYVTYKKRGNDIVDIKFDTYLPEHGSKVAYSQTGTYGLENDPNGGGIRWDEHVSNLEDYIIREDKFPPIDDEGHSTDASSSATINISEFQKAFDDAKQIRTLDEGEKSMYIDLFNDKIS